MAGRKVIIEVRINEYEMRDKNPNVPWTAEEIAADAAACRDAGASIVHFHARETDGSPAFGFEAYRDVIAAVRDRSDILIHSTLGGPDRVASAEERVEHIVRLAGEGFGPDFAPLDMGTTNVDAFDAESKTFRSEEATYVNTTATLRHFANTLRDLGIKPNIQIWNIPMIRWTHAFQQAGLLEGPLLLNFALSGGEFLAAHPPTLKGFLAYKDFLPVGMPCEWTVTVGMQDIIPLAGAIMSEGGHISLGLGDYAYPELGLPTNAGLVERLVQIVTEMGNEAATPAEAKAMLGMN